MNKPTNKVLHFRDLKHEQKVYFVGELNKQRIRHISVCVYKPSINERELFGERYNLYFYATRMLLERLSWFCREQRKKDDPNDGTVALVFSNRSGMSYFELKKYMNILKAKSDTDDVRIVWDIINADQIKSFSPGKRMGLQLADAVASGFFRALEKNPFGYVEPRYAEMLKTTAYKHKGTIMGYGLKLWPAEALLVCQNDPELSWLMELQKE